MGCRTIAAIRDHGSIGGLANNSLASGVKSGMDGSSEAWWECLLVGEFHRPALGSVSCGLRLVSLHEFGEFLGEVNCWGVYCVLGVEPFVSC